jgi:hypothetical protein
MSQDYQQVNGIYKRSWENINGKEKRFTLTTGTKNMLKTKYYLKLLRQI